MKARAVIGANFGDEGKGLVTDWLCSKGAGMVVRSNGGAQAGHTVVAPDGRRHVFHHVGSGALQGVPTFLSKYFICNPILFYKELDELARLGVNPVVYADPQCLVTTFADMIINQAKEDKRGAKRHGSCGVGVHETIQRNNVFELSITMGDLWNNPSSLRPKLEKICDKYARFRTGTVIAGADNMINAFLKGCEAFANSIHPLGIGQCKDVIFEGAQGLLLDQDNKEFFPHVTHSNTGMKNIRELCKLAGIDEIETYYVSRTYLTRHGAGPLPGEDSTLKFHDDTNIEHSYQGSLRFAHIDMEALYERCNKDFGGPKYKLVVTHTDQLSPIGVMTHLCDGPTRENMS